VNAQGAGLVLQVKSAMMHYLHALITIMDPADFVNTMDTRLAVSRIINWTVEPKNFEVRKVSSGIGYIAIMQLPFTALLGSFRR
jgi:hypothetical protein